MPIQTEVFETIAQLKAGRRIAGLVPEQAFARYVQMIELVVEAVEAKVRPRQAAREGGP